ncbi:MAG: hypothetical protein IT437_09665 [Phycisphaerales bacterium]|nr:hypothetical protein [Phycisphaerales bacterium]
MKMLRSPICSATLALVLAAGLWLPGCDDRGPVGQAITDANVKLTSLTPTGGATASDDYKLSVYSEILNNLKPHTGQGTPSQQAATYILLSRAQAGLGEAPAAQAADIERSIQDFETRVRAALDQWRTLSAQAATLSSYDPAEELNAIARDAQDREAAIAREQARRSDVDARVAELRSQAATKAAAAKAKRQEEGTILQAMSNATAVQGDEILRRAVVIRREADALDAESSDLEARAAQVAPQSDRVQLEIDRLTAQRTLLDKNRDEVSARAAAMKERASAAQVEARQAADAVTTVVKEMEATSATLPYDDAAAQFEAAAASAKKAAGADKASRSSAEMAVGIPSQSLGDLRLSQARGLAGAVATYEALAEAVPPLPDAAKYRSTLTTLREGRKAALEAATEAYSAAAEAYKNAGGMGQAKERLESVIMGLARTVKATSGGTKDLAVELGLSEAPPETPSDTGSGDAPPPAAAQAGTPEATIETILGAIKSGQYRTILDYIHTDDPMISGLLQSGMGIVEKAAALSSAMTAKFGKGLMDLGPEATGPASKVDLERLRSLTVADFPVEVTGDTAVVHSPPDLEGPNDGLPMRRIDGVWKIDLSAAPSTGGDQQGGPAITGQQLAMMAAFAGPMIKQAGQVFDDVRTGVEDGTYATLDAVKAALEEKFKAMQQGLMKNMTGGMQPPGGG